MLLDITIAIDKKITKTNPAIIAVQVKLEELVS